MKAVHRARSTVRVILLLVTTIGVLFIRRPDQFLHPYIWVEDGLYILREFADFGYWTLAMPLAGYSMLATKLISVIAYKMAFLWAPEIELALIVAFTCSVIVAVALSPTHLRWPSLCALAVLVVPTDAEVFTVSSYAFWWTGPLLILALLWDDTRGRNWLRWLYIVFGGLSSPIIVPIAVLLWLRAGLERRAVEIFTAGIATVVMVAQILAMRQQGVIVHLDAFMARTPLDLIKHFVGDFFYSGGPRFFGLSIALGLAAVIWFSRSRLDRYFVLLVLAFIAISVVIPLRSPPGQFENINVFAAGPRYFFYPFICLGWILIWLAHESPNSVRIATAAAWLVALVVASPGLSRRHDPIDWRKHIVACTTSDRYQIPIHYNGRIADVWRANYTGDECRKLLGKSVWRPTS